MTEYINISEELMNHTEIIKTFNYRNEDRENRWKFKNILAAGNFHMNIGKSRCYGIAENRNGIL